MDINPLLSQSGGRPPQLKRSKKLIGPAEISKPNSQNEGSARNSNLLKCHEPNSMGEIERRMIGYKLLTAGDRDRVDILEDIQIPEVAQGNMEEDLCSISSVDDGFQVAQNKKEEYKVRCPAYKKFVSLRKKSREEARNRKKLATDNVEGALTQSGLIQGRTFASCFNETPIGSKREKPAFVQEFLSIARSLCSPDPLTLEDEIRNFLGSYKSLSKDQARTRCLKLINDIQNVYGP
ncbi:hypothetical protein EVAR_91272_1 [Eumeta japonica]|uniref:Uncharacterized protein n=1 Tax=Eumeta variegata TaxID=151549 RepID=A0A4C1TF77_EUMVA|nr:hypothetical protein EVAR_91272_1 [Eumeta japonica]